MLGINLYSSAECCLCDDALALLACSKLSAKMKINKVDIYKDKALLVKYRTQIPVLKNDEGAEVLYWPFTQAQLDEWLNAL